MPANSNANPALEDVVEAEPVSRGQMNQAVADFAERAEKIAQETLQSLKSRAEPYMGDLRAKAKPYVEDIRAKAQPYADDAAERLGAAERYIVDRVQKQPVTTTLAVLGVGMLLGLVLAGGRNR